MAQRRVGKEQAREHERRAWEMRIKGATLTEIAAALDVTFQAVSKILQRVAVRVTSELTAEVMYWRAEQRARLEHVIDEAMQAWERSKQSAQTATKKTAGIDAKGSAPGELVTLRIEGQCGDVHYLQQARAALADLRKLDGLDSPIALQATVHRMQIRTVA